MLVCPTSPVPDRSTGCLASVCIVRFNPNGNLRQVYIFVSFILSRKLTKGTRPSDAPVHTRAPSTSKITTQSTLRLLRVFHSPGSSLQPANNFGFGLERRSTIWALGRSAGR